MRWSCLSINAGHTLTCKQVQTRLHNPSNFSTTFISHPTFTDTSHCTQKSHSFIFRLLPVSHPVIVSSMRWVLFCVFVVIVSLVRSFSLRCNLASGAATFPWPLSAYSPGLLCLIGLLVDLLNHDYDYNPLHIALKCRQWHRFLFWATILHFMWFWLPTSLVQCHGNHWQLYLPYICCPFPNLVAATCYTTSTWLLHITNRCTD